MTVREVRYNAKSVLRNVAVLLEQILQGPNLYAENRRADSFTNVCTVCSKRSRLEESTWVLCGIYGFVTLLLYLRGDKQ